MRNQIVLFKVKLCYSKSNCAIQNQTVLFKIKLCYSKSNCVMRNQIVLRRFKTHKMSASTIEFVFEL